MLMIIEDFITDNIDLIDTENWEELLHNMTKDLPNSSIKACLNYFEEAEIDIDELLQTRTNQIIDVINGVLKRLKPGRYKITEITSAIPLHRRYGYTSDDLLSFIYYNPDFWPDNIDIEDSDYDNDRKFGYYLIIAR